MPLKQEFLCKLTEAMTKNKVSQADIVHRTSHNPNYVSDLLKSPHNHCLDTIDTLAKAVFCKAEITLVPMTEQEIKDHCLNIGLNYKEIIKKLGGYTHQI